MKGGPGLKEGLYARNWMVCALASLLREWVRTGLIHVPTNDASFWGSTTASHLQLSTMSLDRKIAEDMARRGMDQAVELQATKEAELFRGSGVNNMMIRTIRLSGWILGVYIAAYNYHSPRVYSIKSGVLLSKLREVVFKQGTCNEPATKRSVMQRIGIASACVNVYPED